MRNQEGSSGGDQSEWNLQEEPDVQTTSASSTTNPHSPNLLSMQEVGPLMREQDAELLESIHNIPFSSAIVSSPSTPHHKSILSTNFQQPTSSFSIPSLLLVEDSDPTERDSPEIPKEPGEICRTGPEIYGERGENYHPLRKLLSGEVTTNYGDQQEEQETTTHKNHVLELEGGMLFSSKVESLDRRRLSEAAQFAKAVGDFTEGEELRIIEDFAAEGEEIDDDDDDDDAPEIRVDDPCREGKADSHKQLPPLKESAALQDLKVKIRPTWPFTELDQLPSGDLSTTFIYKGICSNPPEITKSGMNRGNYAQLHRKAWLEVSDPKHRYGKNLRLYYRHWENLEHPTDMFFDWLDSKGEAEGQPLPDLAECPRSQLDSDTVLYITNNDVSRRYAITFKSCEGGKGRVFDVDGDPVSTGPDGWIFVLRDNVMYGAQKITSVTGNTRQRFHHSSFFGGKAVAAAGIFITDENGMLTHLYPHSGHYRPGEAHVQRMLFFLYHEGVDLRTFDMDTQQIQHVARDTNEQDRQEKKKKVESLHLVPAVHVACFLAHKARFIGEGIFSQIRQIQDADVASVGEALRLIDVAH